MREKIEKKIGCTIEAYLKKIKEPNRPRTEMEYDNPFSIFTIEENEYIYEEVIKKMF